MKDELIGDMGAVMLATGLGGVVMVVMALAPPWPLPLLPRGLLFLAGVGLLLFAYWCLIGIRKFRGDK